LLIAGIRFWRAQADADLAAEPSNRRRA